MPVQVKNIIDRRFKIDQVKTTRFKSLYSFISTKRKRRERK